MPLGRVTSSHGPHAWAGLGRAGKGPLYPESPAKQAWQQPEGWAARRRWGVPVPAPRGRAHMWHFLHGVLCPPWTWGPRS